mgnify:CR=1 FL=1
MPCLLRRISKSEACRWRPSITYNVAMHQPGSGIVCDESDDKISATRQGCNVSSRGVIVVECCGITVDAGSGPEDVEVVAVEVNGMRDGRCRLDLLDYPEGPLELGQKRESGEHAARALTVFAIGSSITFILCG